MLAVNLLSGVVNQPIMQVILSSSLEVPLALKKTFLKESKCNLCV